MQDETLSLRLSKAEHRALRERARRQGISQGSVIRHALRAYGVTPEPDSTRSAYDVIQHLVGRRRGGPRDLSTNPRHLGAYGR
jgi:hypothetical protein